MSQALKASLIELKKPKKEKKPKEKKKLLKNAALMAKRRTEELRHLETLKTKKKRPTLPKLDIDLANKKAKLEREAKNVMPVEEWKRLILPLFDEANKKTKVERYSEDKCTCDGVEGSLCSKCTMIPLNCPCQSTLGIAHMICHNRKNEREAKNPSHEAQRLKLNESIKKAKLEMEAWLPLPKLKREEVDNNFHPLTNPEGGRGNWIDMTRSNPPNPLPSNVCDDGKIAEKEAWVQESCPDGIEGCEVLNMVKRSPPPPSPPKSPPVKQNEWINPIDENQSINAIHDTIFARGKATTTQCYWSLVIDAIVIALVQYYREMCEGCKTDSHKKHDLCDRPVKTVWAKNRKAILSRVDVALLMGKWTSFVYTSCGIRPSEVETLFHLSDPHIF